MSDPNKPVVDFGERRPMSGEMRAFIIEACRGDEDRHYDALAEAFAAREEAEFQLRAAAFDRLSRRIPVMGVDEPVRFVPVRSIPDALFDATSA